MTADRPWAYLRNAAHIDAVLMGTVNAAHVEEILATVQARPRISYMDWPPEWDVANDLISTECDHGAWVRSVKLVDCVTPVGVRDSAQGAIRSAARYAVYALLAWDTSADLLDLPADTLRAMSDLLLEPINYQATLLLPWAIVREAT